MCISTEGTLYDTEEDGHYLFEMHTLLPEENVYIHEPQALTGAQHSRDSDFNTPLTIRFR